MLDAKVLGQLVLMQSVLANLPDHKSIVSFVCRGIKDIPGVGSARIVDELTDQKSSDTECFTIRLRKVEFGFLCLKLIDPAKFKPYRDYVKNFVFTIAVVLEELRLRQENEFHQRELETLVAERTRQLQKEVEAKEKIAQTLMESEKRFRLLINQAPDAIYLSDMDARIVLANEMACKMLGYSSEELLTKTVMDIDPEFGSLDEVQRQWESAGRDNPFVIGGKHRRKDGSEFPVEIRAVVIQINQQNMVLGYVRDISQLIEKENRLRESELKFRTFYNAVEDMFVVHPMMKEGFGTIIDVNDMVVKKLEYSREEILAMTVGDFTPESELYRFQDPGFREQAVRKGIMMFETVFQSRSGKQIPVEVNANVLTLEGRPVIISVARDITERKLAQKKHTELLERNKLILETTLSGFILADMNGRIIDVNSAYTKIVGFSEDEIIGKNISDLEERLSREIIKDRLRSITRKGGLRFTSRHIHKSGEPRYLIMSISLMEQDEKNYIVAFCQDITEQKAAEEEVKRQNTIYQSLNKEYIAQNAELVESIRKITEINRQLEEARIKAEESDRLKSAFLANMSHEIRTPMNGILGFADLLRNPSLSGEKQDQYLQVIQSSGERMLNIINDLVDISKIEAGQVQLNPETFKCGELFSTLFEFFRPEAEKRGLQLSYTANACADEQLTTDRMRLNQVLSNLIKNAMKFTVAGSVEFGCEASDKDYLFFVKDTGIGIRPEFLETIFERFRQADHQEMKTEEGSGLGLSISKAFIEMMGGRIWVESTHGEGSVFYFTLPGNRFERESVNDPDNETELPQALPKKILVAEDDEVSFLLLKEIFESAGIDLIRVCDGNEVVEKVRSAPDIDLVLMDLRLPGLSGFEATRRLKALDPELIVIAQTAFATNEDRTKALDAGCDDFLSKPVDTTELFQKIGYHAKSNRAPGNR